MLLISGLQQEIEAEQAEPLCFHWLRRSLHDTVTPEMEHNRDKYTGSPQDVNKGRASLY
jgi:hypothetical protein